MHREPRGGVFFGRALRGIEIPRSKARPSKGRVDDEQPAVLPSKRRTAALSSEGFQSRATLAACCVLSLGLHLLAREYGHGSRAAAVLAGPPVSLAASWQPSPAPEIEVSLQPLPVAATGPAGIAAPTLPAEPGTVFVTDLAPLPSVPGLETQNEAPLAPLPTLLPQTDSQAERERVLGFNARGFAFGNPGPLLPAPVVPLSAALTPAAPAAQAPRMASAAPVGSALLGGLPPPPNYGLNPPAPPPGTPQTSGPPDGDGPPQQAALSAPSATPAAAMANPVPGAQPAAALFPIMPVAPAAALPPAAASPPPPTAPVTPETPAGSPAPPAVPDKNPAAMPVPAPSPAAPAEPNNDGKTPAPDPKTTPAKPDAVPAEPAKADENKPAAPPNEKEKPAPTATTAAVPPAVSSPDAKAEPEKEGKSAPAAPISVPLTRAAPDADDNATSAKNVARFRGAFRAPRDNNYRLRLNRAKGAKMLVDGMPVRSGSSVRLTAGRHRVEVQVSRDAGKSDSAPPILEITEITPTDE